MILYQCETVQINKEQFEENYNPHTHHQFFLGKSTVEFMKLKKNQIYIELQLSQSLEPKFFSKIPNHKVFIYKVKSDL
jgi:hypothetical protein